MFFANLNVFVAASLILSVLGGALIGTFLMVPIALLAKALSIDVWKSSWLIGYLVIPLVLGIVWARRGLAPP
ncbi:MAG TPA: hypothetical protein VG758_15560, partial [Hyphomicrobiaceae bacterium]|nr:hypothetical protein [Hyphomicrobiaceae bacterium]